MVINLQALFEAVKATYADCVGVGWDGDTPRPDFALSADETKRQAAAAIVATHDPVFLTADKTSIAANGTDAVTVTVSAPKVGAAPVTLLITKPDGSTVTQAVTMTGGAGSVQLKTLLYGSYGITITNSANRTMDVLTVEAV